MSVEGSAFGRSAALSGHFIFCLVMFALMDVKPDSIQVWLV